MFFISSNSNYTRVNTIYTYLQQNSIQKRIAAMRLANLVPSYMRAFRYF